MKYKKSLCIFLTLLLVFSLVGCKKKEEEPAPPPDPNFPVTLDLNGETITIENKPEQVVSLSPAITTLLYELGAQDVLGGVSSYAPEQSKEKTDCGTAQAVDLEAVKGVKPQLLLTDTPLLAEQLTALYQMDVEVLLLRRPTTTEEVLGRAKTVSLALYGKEDGEKAAQDYAKQWNEAWEPLQKAADTIGESGKKSAILLGQLDFTVATGDSFEGKMLSRLGFENLGDAGSHWVIEAESVTEWDPQIIFYDSRISEEDIKARDVYKESQAVKAGALCPVEWGALQTQTLQTLKQYEAMVRYAYPDALESVQTQEDADSPAQDGEESESSTDSDESKDKE